MHSTHLPFQAYRKLALACHPDKNPGREEQKSKEFAIISAA
jgi:curved DNA-binding protein CbpA